MCRRFVSAPAKKARPKVARWQFSATDLAAYSERDPARAFAADVLA
jgi:hypothetical protein